MKSLDSRSDLPPDPPYGSNWGHKMTHFYPTTLKGCRGIVFTHGVRMGGRAGGRKKFVRAVSQKL